MDVDILKSATEEQMEMMIMMMQMDKLPSELTESQSLQFSDHGTTNSLTTQHNFDNPNLSSSSSLLNPSPPLSFHHQEQQVLPSALSNIAAMTRLTHNNSNGDELSSPSYQNKQNSMAAMREMIFRIASMQPIHIDPESVKPPKRRNVKISKDPQSIAARHRRERISERIRILQRLVPGGTKMDTASMLDEAIHYVKFLKNQVQSLERAASTSPSGSSAVGFNGIISNANHSSLPRTYQYLPVHHQLFSPTQMLN